MREARARRWRRSPSPRPHARGPLCASASPMRPEELLPMNLTLSIGSRVPPAVTSTLRPRHAPRRPECSSWVGAPAERLGERRLARRQDPRRLGQATDAVLALRGEPSAVGLDDPRAALAQRPAGSPASPGARTCGCSSPGRSPADSPRPARSCSAGCPPGRRRAWRSCSPRPGAITYTSASRHQLEVAQRLVLGQRLPGKCSPRGIALELADEHRRAGQRLERRRPHEPPARRGLHHPDRVPGTRRQAH